MSGELVAPLDHALGANCMQELGSGLYSYRWEIGALSESDECVRVLEAEAVAIPWPPADGETFRSFAQRHRHIALNRGAFASSLKEGDQRASQLGSSGEVQRVKAGCEDSYCHS